MAHFAHLDDNNVVQNVIVISNDIAAGEFPESEIAGQTYLASLGLTGVWLQTSYNGNFRGRYAGIGYTYDWQLGEFVQPPQPDVVPLDA